jgi:TRAP-type C4-dicarboxylate transport system substrate-binding protein
MGYSCVGWLAAVLASVAAGPALAQAKVTLRVADVYPAGHFVAEALTKPWMEDVKRLSGGTVEFQYYPAEQLGKGKDLLTLTLSGVADVGLVIPAFVSDKLPLSAVAELPGGFSTACQGAAAFWSLASTGMLAEREFGPAGVRVLFATVLPPYQIVSRLRIESLKSFEGQKIYSTGGAKDLTVRKLGAVPTRMSTTEVFESLTRGTIDGGLMAYSTARAYNLGGLVRSATAGENFGSGVITYVIGAARLAQLPAAARDALVEAGAAATRRACATIQDGVQADIDQLRQAGVAMMEMPEADRQEIARRMAGVSQEWAEDLDRRGKPGTAVLSAFRDALKPGSN